MPYSESTTSWKSEAFSANRDLTYIAYTLFIPLASCYLYFVLFTKPGALTVIPLLTTIGVAYAILCVLQLERAFYVLVFFIPLQFKGVEIGFGVLSVTDVMIAILVFVWCLKHLAGGTPIFSGVEIYLLMVWGIVLLLSLASSSDRASSAKQLLRLLSCIAVFLFVYNHMRIYVRILKVIKSLVWSSLFISLYGIVEFFYIKKDLSLFINGVLNEPKRIRTFFDQPNVTATYLAIVAPLIIFLILREKKTSLRWLYSCILALNTVAVGLTFSRSGWLTFVVVLLLVPLTRKIRFGLLAMILIGLFATGFFHNITSRPKSISRRLSIYTNAVPHIYSKPLLGHGINTIPGLRLLEKRTSSGKIVGVTAHSLYLTLLIETGCLGLLSFCLFVGTLLLRMIGLAKRIRLYGVKHLNYYSLNRCLLAAMCALLLTRLFQTGLFQLSMWVLLGLVSATAVIVSKIIAHDIERHAVMRSGLPR
ncbi:MAG: O-antigen ligase family protein [Desulfobacteraceae bacterium]|nr:O-antigen ligase family protein [Desulfobacteraceae bacterium]